MAAELGVTRSSINRWLQWYEALGVEGLLTGTRRDLRRGSPRSNAPSSWSWSRRGRSAGYTSGVWTGPMIADLIEQRFGVRYHNHHIPRLLHDLGFSVQRPRKRLARADAEKQAVWLRTSFPAIKKKPPRVAAS